MENFEEMGEKRQRIVYHLVSNATWQDGKPFTSKDVKFTFDFIKEHKVPIWMPAVEKVLKVEAPDDVTVVMTMAGVSIFNLIDTGGLLVLPEHIWREVGDEWRSFQPNLEEHPDLPKLTKLVGTGPFMLADHKPGEYWRLQWNPEYFKRVPEKASKPDILPVGGRTSQLMMTAAVLVVGTSVAAVVMLRRRRESRRDRTRNGLQRIRI